MRRPWGESRIKEVFRISVPTIDTHFYSIRSAAGLNNVKAAGYAAHQLLRVSDQPFIPCTGSDFLFYRRKHPNFYLTVGARSEDGDSGSPLFHQVNGTDYVLGVVRGRHGRVVMAAPLAAQEMLPFIKQHMFNGKLSSPRSESEIQPGSMQGERPVKSKRIGRP